MYLVSSKPRRYRNFIVVMSIELFFNILTGQDDIRVKKIRDLGDLLPNP